MHFKICEECEGVSLVVTSGPCCSGDDLTIYPQYEGELEKYHLPIYEFKGDNLIVKIGNELHKSEKKDRIDWIYLEIVNGGIIKKIPKNEKPVVTFNIKNEQPIALYAYCSEHGLWKCEIKK